MSDNLISSWQSSARDAIRLPNIDPMVIRAEATRLLEMMNELKESTQNGETRAQELRREIDSRYHLLNWMIAEKLRRESDPESVRLLITSARKTRDGMMRLGKFLAISKRDH